MSRTKWIIFIVVTLGILVSLVAFSGSSKSDVSKVNTDIIQTASSENGNIADHVQGKADSKVILVEYADYQCPGCGTIYPLVKSITEQYKDRMQFVFRNFPITEAHPNAKAAAGSAEAAGLQGKFWEMYDKIYEKQADWSNLSITERGKFFEGLATEIGLDINKFNTDLSSPSITEKINFDTALAKKAGVEATPTFYLNGKKLESTDYGTEAKFKEAIDAALKKAGA